MADTSQPAAVHLREGRDEDLEAMYQLDVRCFQPPFRFSRAAMRRFARARGAFTVVAEDGTGALAGFLIVQVSHARPEAYIVTLDVREDLRRQGVAGRLLDAAEKRAMEEDTERMSLHVWTGNHGAIRFYERAGYQRMQLHPAFYNETMDALGYAKPIRSPGAGMVSVTR